ncbi:rhomboid family intramembrane serine protease, partial [Streptomyces sp. OF1]|nr:rhomboid family intramembrane serine protease [Streptomyces alkaliterrae]
SPARPRPPRLLRAARAAPVSHALAAGCVLGSLLAAVGPGAGPGAQRRWGVVPAELWGGGPAEWTTLLTSQFVHTGWLHLPANLLFLLLFGPWVERRVGGLPFLLGCLTVGPATALGHATLHPDSTDVLVGASGTVAGVLGAFLLLFPRARITALYPALLFLPLRLPAWLALGCWAAVQWLAARSPDAGAGGGTSTAAFAHQSHLLGFALGLLLGRLHHRRTRPAAPGDAEITGKARGGVPR